jgi:hypothetical protein
MAERLMRRVGDAAVMANGRTADAPVTADGRCTGTNDGGRPILRKRLKTHHIACTFPSSYAAWPAVRSLLCMHVPVNHAASGPIPSFSLVIEIASFPS